MDFCLRFAPLTISICLTLSLKAQPPDYTIDRAESLYKEYKLHESHAVYSHIAADAANQPSQRVKAYLAIAGQDWRFYKDYASATHHLQLASDLKADLYNCDLLSSTINRQAGYYKAALTDAGKSLDLATNEVDRINAELAFAGAVHDRNFYRLAHHRPLNHNDLLRAVALLNSVLEKQPGNPDASELMIGTGLLLKNGPLVIKGWKSYYLVSDEQNINQVLAPGFKLLKSFTHGNGGAINADKLRDLALGLADTKFFNYSDVVIKEIKAKYPVAYHRSKPLRDIAAYAAYIDGVKKVDDDIYPRVALGLKHYENTYDSLMDIPGRDAWKQLSFIPKNQKYDPDTLYNVLNRKYDMEGYSGTTVGYYGMLMGHVIHKELKQISQYGYATKFTYIALDRLISRDFTSWYGTTNVGGWGDSTTIIQVRKAYMTEPFEELAWMTDSTARRNILTKIAAAKAGDYSRCDNDMYTEPKFLAPYLKYNEATKIYKRLTAADLKGMELNIAFIDEILKLTVASTVFAHEGRHAIDQLYFPKEFKAMSDDERELRAKFSEVIYSLDPKMAFTGSILGSDLGENTNHGRANSRFCKIIVDWMRTHHAEITGLDDHVPLLMQFDLLTNEQLIAICKSADPLAKMAHN